MKNERAVFGVNVERKVRRKVGGERKEEETEPEGQEHVVLSLRDGLDSFSLSLSLFLACPQSLSSRIRHRQKLRNSIIGCRNAFCLWR